MPVAIPPGGNTNAGGNTSSGAPADVVQSLQTLLNNGKGKP
jgi:hypothetical protein